MDLSGPDEEVILMVGSRVLWSWRAEKSGWLSRSGLERIGDMVEIGLWYGKIERDLRPTVKQVNLMMDGAIVTPPPN